MPDKLTLVLPSRIDLPPAPSSTAFEDREPRLAALVNAVNSTSHAGLAPPVVHEGAMTTLAQLLTNNVPVVFHHPITGALVAVRAEGMDQRLLLPGGRVTTPRVLVGEGLSFLAPTSDGMAVNREDVDLSFVHLGHELNLDQVQSYCCDNATRLAGPALDPQTVLSNMRLIFDDMGKVMSTRQRRVWKAMCDTFIAGFQAEDDEIAASAGSTSRST